MSDYQSYFFNLMDVLVDWHDNYKGLELSNITVTMVNSKNSQTVKNLLVIGYIRDSEREIKELIPIARKFPDGEDGIYIKKLSEWFELGNPYDTAGEINAFYQTCGVFTSAAEVIQVMNELETQCRQKYSNVSIRFDKPTGSGGHSTNGGCYIATAVYGSYDCPEVWTLRRFRDNILSQHLGGKIFIKIYYKTSPWMVRHFGKTILFDKLFRNMLDSFVERLNTKGISSNRYMD